MFYKAALLSAVSLSLVLPVWAQEDAQQDTLDKVIVEGSRLSQTETEIGSSVTIITADDIEELGFDFALDAVAAAPGVTVNSNGAFGGVASVRIRGAATDQTLVIIDGVAANDPSSPSGFNFASLDAENIERIEVLKGPQSTLWGSDAIGGVVSIITKRPEEGFGGSAFGEYGSYNTFRGGASVEGTNDNGDFRLAAVGISSDGISKADEDNGNTEDDPYESVTVSAKGGLNFGADARLATSILWSDTESEFDSFVFGAQGNVADGEALSESEELSANVSLSGSVFDGSLENLLLIGYSDIERESSGADTFPFQAEGDRTLFRYQGTLNINEGNTLAFGVEREETGIDGDDTSIDSLFGLYEFKPAIKLTLTGGLRVDDHETFGTETTGRVAAAFNSTDALTFRASWGQGFKAPTLDELSGGGFAAPNPDLQPETSQAFDAGIDWRSRDGRFAAGLTIYDQDIEDLIQFAFSGYFNEANVEAQGVELTGFVQVVDWLSVDANYGFIDATDTNGNQLQRIPEHSGDVNLRIDPEGPFSGSVLVRYNGEETDGAETVDSWTRVDVNGSYDLNDRVELFGRIENLFDEDYQQTLGYGTPDLSGYLGVRLRY